jgi:predicted RNA methylase
MTALAQLFLPEVPPPKPNRFDGSTDGFFTSGQDADALVAFADVRPEMCVLEPSAGEGAIVHALMRLPAPPAQIVAIEMHKPFADNLRATCEKYGERVVVVNADYFKVALSNERHFDIAVMNPPYRKFLDVRFIEKALKDTDKIAALLLSSSLHNPKRAAVWNESRIEKIDLLARRPGAFDNGQVICHKPMREYVRIMAARSEETQRVHFPVVKLA